MFLRCRTLADTSYLKDKSFCNKYLMWVVCAWGGAGLGSTQNKYISSYFKIF